LFACAELSIDIPAESPVPSSKKSKKRKAKDSSGSKEKKLKKSKSRSSLKAEKPVEINYEEGTDVDDEPPEVKTDTDPHNTSTIILTLI